MQIINDKAYNRPLLQLGIDEANIIADVLKTKELVLQSRFERQRSNYVNTPCARTIRLKNKAQAELETVRKFIHFVTYYNDTHKD